MLSPKYYLYLITGPGLPPRQGISSNPRVDAYLARELGYEEIQLIQPPQPISIAEPAGEALVKSDVQFHPTRFPQVAKKIFQQLIPQLQFTCQHLTLSELSLPHFDPPDLEPLLQGRVLLGTELPELIKSAGWELPWDPEDWLQYLCFQARLSRKAAVGVDLLGVPYCRRCGSSQNVIEDDCLFCGSRHCYTCVECRNLGIAKSCIPLYSKGYSGLAEQTPVTVRPHLQFELTLPQQRASCQLVEFWNSKERDFLVWAVCGAGKTEVCFDLVAKVLSEGRRVLIAIPRKDIVQELLPRFEQAFPEVSLSGIYGGSGTRYTDSSLVIATTHQVLRMYQAFDLIILDEGDAFPYQGSAMLHYAVERALKPEGRLVLMTATPDKLLLNKVKQGKIGWVSIPARPHRRPLIVPEHLKADFKPEVQLKQGWEPPSFLGDFILGLKRDGRKALIFLPLVNQVQTVGTLLCRWSEKQDVKGAIAHSKVNDRNDLKLGLVQGTLDYLVTSTVFERGITIPNLDVMVLLADNSGVFDCRTLVQIAGRVSRRGEPARVIYVAKTVSGAMKESIDWIKKMNEEGDRLGYLDQ